MPYEFLLDDLKKNLTPKTIGTDKGLAKIGDAIVNLTYSVAKSIYLTKKSSSNIIRTGIKVNQTILSQALKNAEMKYYAKNRADAHAIADSVEAVVAYVWFNEKITLNEIIDFLAKNLSGDLNLRHDEIKSATVAFTNLLIHIKKFLPEE